MPGRALIVDVHCHMFNAADLPLRGFVEHVALQDGWFGSAHAIAAVAAKLVGRAPGFEHDQQLLKGLLVGGLEADDAGIATFDETAVQAVADLDPGEYATVAAAMAPFDDTVADEDVVGGEEALGAGVVRFVRWAKLFSKSRADLVGLYHEYFANEVTLAIPMLVDLAAGLHDDALTTPEQQVVLFDLLSQAAMLGLLPHASGLAIHPFVGFDPLRVLDGKVAADGRSAMQVVQDAVLKSGFVGVKVYPEMGWRAAGNTAANTGTSERATKLNQILDEFFGWCADNDVPVTAHCNHSNFSNAGWRDAGFGSPDEWKTVLAAHPTLHLNLGHFGGAHDNAEQYTWAWTIASMMDQFGYLHADVGCQRVDDDKLMNVHFGVLAQMANSTTVLDRLMFGTDWYMEAVNPKSKQFLDRYRDKFRTAFGEPALHAFMGGTALRFLGFADDSFTQNGARLRQRYANVGVAPPAWLGGQDAPDPNGHA